MARREEMVVVEMVDSSKLVGNVNEIYDK